VVKGQRLCYILSDLNYREIVSEYDGEITDIYYKQGESLHKGDVIMKIR
ncbi:MAG: acetyl-CoA carboxylase, biotin carboxyl carrier protein, partial [Bacteroidetes bacterium]|nr:acetyl-CoA carboxylase, biotin carboxyl carrier protein [Bacteroidota bacterium]MBT4728314.1 acetyl-CoA carboxylase, biotin carboxyl carrier protein [Bacteroidota bacterium]MBT6834652.1 acetyl-CoA carboxylase, biotin carboxyl carrier protein [Bacteroidota bacterium]MBT7995329.1 acetyl-CoA carboxylase, biotin carboxyl carrier protein [Bacteroidota bacterium]